MICPKINSRIFKSKNERRKHTAAEFYNTYMGEDYEKEMGAAFERLVLSNFHNERFADEMGEVKKSFWDEVNRLYTACRYCRGYYREFNAYSIRQ